MTNVQLVAISKVKVKRRVRRDLGDLEPLMASLRKHGMLNPIIVGSDFELIAGQRRLESATRLGWASVPCRIAETTDELAKLEIEIEENASRKDFSSDEMADALGRLDRLNRPSWWRRLLNWFRRILRRLPSPRRRRPGDDEWTSGM